MIARSDQSIKPYRTQLPLRERARLALEAEQAVYAKQRAAALARAQVSLAGSLVLTCRRLLDIDIDRAQIEVLVFNEERTLSATVIVESILLSVGMSTADAARLSGPIPLGTLRAAPHCPVCGTALSASTSVCSVADLGRVLGEVGCGGCGWEPSA